MKYIVFLFLFIALLVNVPEASAQIGVDVVDVASEEAEVTPSTSPAQAEKEEEKKDITRPEEENERKEVLKLLERRRLNQISITNFVAYSVQYAVNVGVPANTITLILLLPFLATIVVIFRYLIGLPSLGLLVPIALSVTLLDTGLLAGMVLLFTIIIASLSARFLLRPVRIMQLPKLSLAMLVVSILIFLALTVSAATGIFPVRQISIFPVLFLIIMSDRIVALFLERSIRETLKVTAVTITLAVLGFFLLAWKDLQTFILLYPELILLLVPLNIIIGRYFGLRVSEYLRFQSILQDGSK